MILLIETNANYVSKNDHVISGLKDYSELFALFFI